MKKLVMLMVLIVLLLSSSCNVKQDITGQDAFIPFMDIKGNIIPVYIKIRNFDDYKFYLSSDSILNERLAFYGLKPCENYTMIYEEGRVVINSDKEPDEFLIYSLLKLNGVSEVKFGNNLYKQSYFENKTIVYYVRYTNDEKLLYIPVFINILTDSIHDRMNFVCSNMYYNDAFSCINKYSRIESYTEKDNCLYLTMNDDFFDYGGSLREEGMLGQIARMYNEYSRIYITNEEYNNILPEGSIIKDGIETIKAINKIDLW